MLVLGIISWWVPNSVPSGSPVTLLAWHLTRQCGTSQPNKWSNKKCGYWARWCCRVRVEVPADCLVMRVAASARLWGLVFHAQPAQANAPGRRIDRGVAIEHRSESSPRAKRSAVAYP